MKPNNEPVRDAVWCAIIRFKEKHDQWPAYGIEPIMTLMRASVEELLGFVCDDPTKHLECFEEQFESILGSKMVLREVYRDEIEVPRQVMEQLRRS
jgi:hypothetical protein